MPNPEHNAVENVNGTLAEIPRDDREVLIEVKAALPVTGVSETSARSFLICVVSLAAVFAFFVLEQRLWATLGLGVMALLGYVLPSWRNTTALTQVLFAYCGLSYAINNEYFAVAYPYSNIFILTGLLGLFFLSGKQWSQLYFAPGKTKNWTRPAALIGIALSALILAVYFWRPELVGKNPTPRQWPLDVVIVVAVGYATFSTLMEETIFRSMILSFARAQLKPGLAVIAQAVVFAAMHYHFGFPSQALGSLLAFLWGLAAGLIVVKSESIYPAYVLHFVLVLALFIVLAFVS